MSETINLLVFLKKLKYINMELIIYNFSSGFSDSYLLLEFVCLERVWELHRVLNVIKVHYIIFNY